ncbi:hypothetical protein [Telluribacter sp. SYSU D00476]|uniref:hypothetical protein n=1 Tax=Telluribacter sp. SYSU D00476 TaxID=2811430 RepID=UPI001FF2CA9D|nr:hypothetical protein [Telluribacter sp. SYSU D00476]
MDELSNQWKKARTQLKTTTTDSTQLVGRARQRQRSSQYFQLGNILVLTITLIGVGSFFYWVAPVREVLSRVGVVCMLGGLLLRIAIEVWSIYKSRKIRLGTTTLQATQEAVGYYSFRKRVHGPVTLSIVGMYILGFYLLTPEFSLYIPFNWMVLMHVSFVVMAVFLFVQIRKGIKKEMKSLAELIEIQNDLQATPTGTELDS